MKCQNCERYRAKWGVYKAYSDGHKAWLIVCDKCEKVIGDENFKRSEVDYEGIGIKPSG